MNIWNIFIYINEYISYIHLNEYMKYIHLCKWIYFIYSFISFTSTNIFLVFMWRHHFTKQKNVNLCEVLVLSDVRPSKNVTFCNVWARKGSSLCNRVRLNFQVCTLRDIEMSDWNLSSGVKDELLFKFLLTKQFLI